MDEARRALQRGLEELELEERLILRMHYESGLTVAAIAKALGLTQRQLYTRCDRALRQLRRRLEGRGLDADGVLRALRWSGGERKLDFGVAPAAAEGDHLQPSNPSEATAPPPR